MRSYKNLFQLTGQVAVITGAAGILGTEFCHALSDLGAKVVCLDIEEKALMNLVDNLVAKDPQFQADYRVCNVSDPSQVQKTVGDIIQKHGQIDILLNNAATKTKDLSEFFAPFHEYSLEIWREVMAVNLDGMFLMAQAVGHHMVQQKKGVIVQTASIYSLMAPDQRIYDGSSYLNREINTPAVYTASKAGVIGLTKHLATLWGAAGVRVNALCPGGVESGQNETFNQRYAHRVPMARMAHKKDIVGPMLFLVSEAASYVTGQVYYVDGGLSAW